MKYETKHLIAAAAVGAVLAGGAAAASILRPQTFATRWDTGQSALTKMQTRLPQETIDALHNRALEILHGMDAHAVAKDDASDDGHKKTAMSDTTCKEHN